MCTGGENFHPFIKKSTLACGVTTLNPPEAAFKARKPVSTAIDSKLTATSLTTRALGPVVTTCRSQLVTHSVHYTTMSGSAAAAAAAAASTLRCGARHGVRVLE